nr:immunoglobulin light chain junction region [Macaca mulatta]
CQYETNWSLTF